MDKAKTAAGSRQGFPAGAEAFAYKNGALAVENVPLAQIAAAVGTPFYVYSATAIQQNYQAFCAAFAAAGLDMQAAYAVKANSARAVLRLLAREGAGADIVSGGELFRALEAGIDPAKIIYSGAGKTAAEMDYALQSGIGCFNAESVAEITLLAERAAALGLRAPLALRINPDIDAGTHAKITTGKAENKFGIPHCDALAAYKLAASLPALRICGLDVHIGSQIESAAVFERAFAFAAALAGELRAAGFPLAHLDIGGGLGIAYKAGKRPPPAPAAYAALAAKHLGKTGLRILTEPGRFITGNAGALVMQVQQVKQAQSKNFIITDAGMNDLLRPTLYEAWHEILPVAEAGNAGKKRLSDIVGPVCETGDYLALQRDMPPPPAGALLAALSCGAYGASMASRYNSRSLPAEVMAEGSRFALIRKRESYAEIMAGELLPNWL